MPSSRCETDVRRARYLALLFLAIIAMVAAPGAALAQCADLLVRADTETDAAFAANDTYQQTPTGDQIEAVSSGRTVPVTYVIKVENDDSTALSYCVKAVLSATTNWSAVFKKGDVDITSDITGSGYTTDSLAAGGSVIITVRVTPGNGLSANDTQDITVSAYEDGLSQTVLDAVKLTTTATGGKGYFAATDGTAQGDGTIGDPWDLQTALDQPATVYPGDTIWVRGGTYAGHYISYLTGTAQAPIHVRAYLDEKPVIDGASGAAGNMLGVYGDYTYFYDFEITDSNADHTTGRGVEVLNSAQYGSANGVKFINMTVHDCGSHGFGFWQTSEGSEMCGNVVFMNGTQSNAEYGVYLRNGSPTKTLSDNLFWSNRASGVFAYGSLYFPVSNLLFEGNASFENGGSEFSIGGGGTTEGIVFSGNYAYTTVAGSTCFGSPGQADDVTISDNIFRGAAYTQPVTVMRWDDVTMSGNKFVTPCTIAMQLDVSIGGDPATYVWEYNEYHVNPQGSSLRIIEPGPQTSIKSWSDWKTDTGLDAVGSTFSLDFGSMSGSDVSVRANPYDPARANVVIYNWAEADNVTVSLTSVSGLHAGDVYEVRDAQNFTGPAIASGTYNGSTVTIPMTGTVVASPVRDVFGTVNHTGKEFGAFVVGKARPRADLLVRREDQASSAYDSDNVYQQAPSGDQIEAVTATRSTTAVYLVKIENDGDNPATFCLTADPSATTNWTTVYKHGATDITSQITGSGYTTGLLDTDDAEVITVRVTPGNALSASDAQHIVIAARADGTSGVLDAVKLSTTAGSGKGWFAAPNGTANGDGSIGDPWDLQTALSHPQSVSAGDTIWLRGGTYSGHFTSSLIGTSQAPIVVRGYTGEWPVIDGAPGNAAHMLAVSGCYTHYRDFELMDSNPDHTTGSGIYTIGGSGSASGTKFINLVVHDCAMHGFGFWRLAEGAEMCGNVIYMNGYNYNVDHGIYTQNEVPSKTIRENMIWFNRAYGIHAYGSGNAYLKYYLFEGNTTFANGVVDVLVGGGCTAEAITFRNNYCWTPMYNSLSMGYSATNEDLVFTGNIIRGAQNYQSIAIKNWNSATVTGNKLVTPGTTVLYLDISQQGNPANYTWDGNEYHGVAAAANFRYCTPGPTTVFESWAQWHNDPGLDTATSTLAQDYGSMTTNDVIVRPNPYDAGRANITIFNWKLDNSVDVDLSDVTGLSPGDTFEIRDVENYKGAAVVTGTYTGAAVTIPMTGTSVSTPVRNVFGTVNHTSQEFGAFVVIKTN